jgi:hypothetical protein
MIHIQLLSDLLKRTTFRVQGGNNDWGVSPMTGSNDLNQIGVDSLPVDNLERLAQRHRRLAIPNNLI